VECVNLLWNLIEASPVALATFNQLSLLDTILLPILSQETLPDLGNILPVLPDPQPIDPIDIS
jgi:hypothetical protein